MLTNRGAMNYTDLLINTSRKNHSIVCLGMDPVLELIPLDAGSVKKKIIFFYETILESLEKSGVYPGAVKPNYAFFAQYGLEGIEALYEIIQRCRNSELPVILDFKRGDIGTTAAAYSREAYDFFKADAVTLSPFMGYDSISPFIDNYPEKGCYILNKTSNKSSGDLQDLDIGGEPLYIHLSRKIIEWHHPGMGAVVGATYPGQLRAISDIYIASGKVVPLLIPGVGAQGGSVKDVCEVLKLFPDPGLHRINSSSAINYAYKQHPDLSYGIAAARALDRLNREINSYLL